MAIVRLNAEINNHIIKKIEEMFEPRLKAKHAQIVNINGLAFEMFMTIVNKDEFVQASKLAAMNKSWVREARDMYLSVTIKDSQGNDYRYPFTVPFKPPVPAPLHQIENQRYYAVPNSIPQYQELVKLVSERRDIEIEKIKLVDAMKVAIHQCGTLQQLVKIWPTALDFVTDDARKRYMQPTTKRTRTELQEVSEEAKVLLTKAKFANLSTENK